MSKLRKRKALFFTIGPFLLLAAAITFDVRARAYYRAFPQNAPSEVRMQHGSEQMRLEGHAQFYYLAAALGGLFGLIALFRPALLEWRPEEQQPS